MRILISAVVTAVMVLSAAVSYGSTSDQIKQKENQLQQGQQQESQLSGQITDLENSIAKAESAISELESQISATENKIQTVSAKVEKKKKELDKGNDDLNGRLRNIYKSGTVGFIDVILSSDNVSDLLSNMEMVKEIYANDKKIVAALQTKYDKIKAQEKELKALKADLDEKEQTLSSKQAALKEDKSSLSAKKASVSANNQKIQGEIDDLKAEADALSGTIGGYDNGGKYTGGSMMWPVNGSVTCGYGWRICPIHGKEFHTGIDIGASTGQTVVAASSGTVRQAGSNGGYGNSVIITHGGGITTLYGHNSYVSVSVGQRVKKGQKIAGAGSTGNSTGPHVHFEVRVNGSYVNPMNYL